MIEKLGLLIPLTHIPPAKQSLLDRQRVVVIAPVA